MLSVDRRRLGREKAEVMDGSLFKRSRRSDDGDVRQTVQMVDELLLVTKGGKARPAPSEHAALHGHSNSGAILREREARQWLQKERRGGIKEGKADKNNGRKRGTGKEGR